MQPAELARNAALDACGSLSNSRLREELVPLCADNEASPLRDVLVRNEQFVNAEDGAELPQS